MPYECNCSPQQAIPHITKSPHVKRRLWGLYEILGPAKSCDGQLVPLRRFNFKGLSFGKLIHGTH